MSNFKDKMIDATGEAAGAAVAAGVGLVVAGPAGAIFGATLGSVINSISSDVLSRLLSKKEKERIDQVNKFAVKKIEENVDAGKTLREDEFFKGTVDDRSTAEEIYEGVLLASQKEYEERKIEFLGRLFGNIAFDSNITRPIANALVKEASDLTYQQLKIIKAVGALHLAAKNGLDARRVNDSNELFGITNISIASDIVELYHKTIIHSSSVILDVTSINPAELTLVGRGALLFNLMELEKTEIDDVETEVMNFLTNALPIE